MVHIGIQKRGVNETKYICGGTLISEKFVLTAAHCSRKGVNLANIVRLNSTRENSLGAITRKIKTFRQHEKYRQSSHYDVALIELDNIVEFEIGGLRPACLWTSDTTNIKDAIVTGWGATGFASNGSSNLLKAKVDLVNLDVCKKAMCNSRTCPVNDQLHICNADSNSTTRRDSCQGGDFFLINNNVFKFSTLVFSFCFSVDSGGPLQIIQEKDNPCMAYVVGVISSGSACGLNNSKGLNVKVSEFLDWIENIVWKE